MFLRSPQCVGGLRNFLSSRKTALVVARKAMQVLASIPGEEANAALEQLVRTESASETVRQLALETSRKRQAKPAKPSLSATPADPSTIQ
jgi:hypothetical protein